jgi:Transposase
MPRTGNIDRVEVITSVQRRRRWSAEEKARIVQETYAPGMSVSLVARQHGSRRTRYSNGDSSDIAVEYSSRFRPGYSAPQLETSKNLVVWAGL